MVGVNPEKAHEDMAGLHFPSQLEFAMFGGVLWHMDANDQDGCRFDQDFNFAFINPLDAFWTVETLDRLKYQGPINFDCKPLRTEGGPAAFVKANVDMWTLLEERVATWREDKEIKRLLKAIADLDAAPTLPTTVTDVDMLADAACPEDVIDELMRVQFDPEALAAFDPQYQSLAHRTNLILMNAA